MAGEPQLAIRSDREHVDHPTRQRFGEVGIGVQSFALWQVRHVDQRPIARIIEGGDTKRPRDEDRRIGCDRNTGPSRCAAL